MMTERDEKLKKYQQLNEMARKGQIVFAGSSLAEQFPINEMLNNIGKRFIVYNRGISGDTSADLLSSLETCVFALEPSKLFINIGTNDMNESYVQENLLLNYSVILRRIQERLPRTDVFILSYYPVNSRIIAGFTQRTNDTICRANERLKELTMRLHYQYVNVHDILLDDEAMLRKDYTTDGVHLLPIAYEKILQVLVGYFEPKNPM